MLRTFVVGILLLVSPSAMAAQSGVAKVGALAVDRSSGFYYGFAVNHSSREEAENRAKAKCLERGGSCVVVLVWSGTGCSAYRAIPSRVGTAYGWGAAASREEADAIANREALKRSGGEAAPNHVWGCNSPGSGPHRTLFNDPGTSTSSVFMVCWANIVQPKANGNDSTLARVVINVFQTSPPGPAITDANRRANQLAEEFKSRVQVQNSNKKIRGYCSHYGASREKAETRRGELLLKKPWVGSAPTPTNILPVQP